MPSAALENGADEAWFARSNISSKSGVCAHVSNAQKYGVSGHESPNKTRCVQVINYRKPGEQPGPNKL